MKRMSVNMSQVKATVCNFVHDTGMLPGKVHAAVFGLSLLVSTHAMAAGVSGFFAGWKSAMTNLLDLVLLGGMVVGICSIFYGLMQLVKKGMNRGEDIEWSKISWPIIGGALLTTILYVAQAVVEEGGASKSDMGRTN